MPIQFPVLDASGKTVERTDLLHNRWGIPGKSSSVVDHNLYTFLLKTSEVNSYRSLEPIAVHVREIRAFL